MGILGVLLGITICTLGWSVWFMKREHRYLRDLNHASTLNHQRIDAVEEDKSKDVAALIVKFSEVDARFDLIESAMATTEKTVKAITAPKARPISWSQARDAAEAGDGN